MGATKVYLPDEIERKFRETAMKLYGYKKGALSIAAEKAISRWISEQEKTTELVKSIKDPVEAISGMLSDVKKSGVELQHEASKIRSTECTL